MKMTCDSLCNRHFWEERGITLPSYDVEAEKTSDNKS